MKYALFNYHNRARTELDPQATFFDCPEELRVYLEDGWRWWNEDSGEVIDFEEWRKDFVLYEISDNLP